MDIISAIQTAPLVDLAIFLGLFAAFIVGVMQGAVRRVIGIISILFAFLVAANLRDPVGDYLSQHWTQFPTGYNHMIAFAGSFALIAVGASIVTQGFYKRTDLYARQPIVDDAVGGLLGVVEGVILLLIAIVILRSYTVPPDFPGVEYLREVQNQLIHASNIAGALRDDVVPIFIRALSALLPPDIVSMFP